MQVGVVGRTGAGMCCISCRMFGDNVPFDRQKLTDAIPLPVF